MSDRTAMLVERDPEDLDDVRAPASRPSSLPEGLSGSNVEVPSRAPAQRGGAEPEFEIIDTDSDFRPIRPDEGTAAPAQDAGADDGTAQEPSQDGQAGRRERDDRSPAFRRARQKSGRERTLQENARLHGEIAELRDRLNSFEPRLSEFDQARLQDTITAIDRQIDEQAQRATAARRQMSEAMVSQDPEALNAALDARDQAIIHGQRLLAQKSQLAGAGAPRGDAAPRQQFQQPAPQQRQAPGPMPSQVRAYVADFAQAHDWFNPSDASDLDSKIVLDIDNAVAADGFAPNTQDYWDEVEDRMRQYLPHRFAAEQPQRQQQQARPARAAAPAQRQQAAQPERRGPMTSGASDRGPAPSPNQVYLSPERKETMVLAGVLERDGKTVADKAKFNRLLKQYQDYDRANGVAR